MYTGVMQCLPQHLHPCAVGGPYEHRTSQAVSELHEYLQVCHKPVGRRGGAWSPFRSAVFDPALQVCRKDTGEEISAYNPISHAVFNPALQVCRKSPGEKGKYIKIILALLQSTSAAVVYECAVTLVSLSQVCFELTWAGLPHDGSWVLGCQQWYVWIQVHSGAGLPQPYVHQGGCACGGQAAAWVLWLLSDCLLLLRVRLSYSSGVQACSDARSCFALNSVVHIKAVVCMCACHWSAASQVCGAGGRRIIHC